MLKVSQVRLLVSDFGSTFRFYRDVLGFTPTFGSENDVYASFDVGGAAFALFRKDLMAAEVGTAELPSVAAAQDSVALVFETEDVDALYERLLQSGTQFVAPPVSRPDWGIRAAHLRDPEGNLVEIYSDLAGTP